MRTQLAYYAVHDGRAYIQIHLWASPSYADTHRTAPTRPSVDEPASGSAPHASTQPTLTTHAVGRDPMEGTFILVGQLHTCRGAQVLKGFQSFASWKYDPRPAKIWLEGFPDSVRCIRISGRIHFDSLQTTPTEMPDVVMELENPNRVLSQAAVGQLVLDNTQARDLESEGWRFRLDTGRNFWRCRNAQGFSIAFDAVSGRLIFKRPPHAPSGPFLDDAGNVIELPDRRPRLIGRN